MVHPFHWSNVHAFIDTGVKGKHKGHGCPYLYIRTDTKNAARCRTVANAERSARRASRLQAPNPLLSDATATMVAPVSSPTVIPRSPVFPRLLPLPPHPHPIPPAESFHRRERFINYRDIWREMDELSEEEGAIEVQVRLRSPCDASVAS